MGPFQGQTSTQSQHVIGGTELPCGQIFLISFAAALTVLSLSEMFFLGSPLLAENCFKHRMKVAVDMSNTSSRWIAWVTQQVNRQIHILALLAPSLHLTYIAWAGKVNCCV